jgi:DNA-binding CsgD family transcriptional regulator/PAS domain-containing protein
MPERMIGPKPVSMMSEAESSRQSSRAIRAIYSAALEPARWPEALQAVADVLEDVGAILIYGRDDGTFGVVCSPSLDHCVADYAAGWSDRDTRANRARDRGYFIERDVVTDRDVISPEEMSTDPFYSEFLPRYGLRYFACAMVSPDPRTLVGMSIQRRPDRPEYSDGELALVGELGAHVEKALRLSIRLMNAELVNAGLGAALTRLGMGVFALDSLGRIVFQNPAGEALLGDGLDRVDGRLCAGLAGSELIDAEIARAIADQPDHAGKPAPLLIERDRSRRPLAVYVMPIPLSDRPAEHGLAHARALVLVVDPDTDAPPDPSLVRDLLGLTLGEARIAALIGSGLPPQEAADKLGVSVETARTVLKRVFQKVGVSRQSELAALMTRLMLR